MEGLVKDTPKVGNFVMDWLEFTYKPSCRDVDCDLWSDFIMDFPEFQPYIEHMVMLEKGKNWYTCVVAFGRDFMIMYNSDRPEMGVHVQFPGSGMYRLCEVFGLEGTSDFLSVAPLFKKLKERDCKISRIDLCYDDFDYRNHFTPDDFGLFAMLKRISSRTNKMEFIQSTQTKGATFYLGSRGGERYLRIYDKNYESKGAIDSVRYELQLKDAHANAIFNHINEGKQFSFADLLSNMFNVTNEYEYDKSLPEGTLRRRKFEAGILAEWEEFLDTIRKIPILGASDIVVDRVKRECSMDKSLQWISKYALPTLYMLKEVHGSKLLQQLIDEFEEDKLSKQQLALLNAYRKQNLRDFAL